jgi:CheY-like chemotaxis protein
VSQEKTTNILVIDDDPDFLAQQEIQLSAAGYDVRTAGGQREAEEALAAEMPDLVIVDLMMEQMDGGFTICHKVKQADPSVPVILVTAVTSETGLEFDAATSEERSWVKADTVLAKPIRFEQLRREVERLLGRTT